MRVLRNLRLRISWLLKRSEAETDLNDELKDYIERQTEQHIARGLSRELARATALRELGGVEQLKEECRDVRRAGWLEDAWRDLLFGLRTLWHAPGFTATAVLALALCMGANTAIFTVVNTVLFRPLGFPDQDRLLFLTEGLPTLGFPIVQFACPDYLFMRAHARSLESLAAYENGSYEISIAGNPRQATGTRATASLFEVLGIKPLLGRAFTAEEDESAKSVVVLSTELAVSSFGSAENAVGRTMRIDRRPYSIVGVMPPSFSFPSRTRFDDKQANFFVPISWSKHDREETMNNFNYSTIARLRSNVSVAQATAEIKTLVSHLPDSYPAQTKAFLKGMPHFTLDSGVALLHEEVTGKVKRSLFILLAAVGMVLLIGCADVANLLFSRMVGRQREFAVRAAVGASTGRLIRQALAEGLILSALGGVAGLACAFWGLPMFLRLAPGDLPRLNEIRMDGQVVLFVLAIVLATPVLSALIPMIYVLPSALANRLREGGRSATQGKQQRFFMSAAVITQFSLAFVLLAAASLLIRSFLKASESDPGFAPAHVISVPIRLPQEVYQKPEAIRRFYRELLSGVSKLPGVQRAGAISTLPMYYTGNGLITPEGRGEHTERTRMLWSFGSSLETLGTPLVRGRLLGPGDDLANDVRVVISETLAKRSWPGLNPIGRRLKQGSMEWPTPWMTVVGVVKDVKESQSSVSPNPILVSTEAQYTQNDMHLVIRISGDVRALATAIRKEVHRLDPDLPVEDIQTIDAYLDKSLAPERFRTFLLASFAGIALLLSVVGIAGLLSYNTAQRRQEFGVRLALGATRSDLVQLVFAQGLKLSLAGIAIGLLASLLVTRTLGSFLYETSPYDPLTFIGVPLLLVLVAMIASVWPAWRAGLVNASGALNAN
jgi:predicted permease